MLARFEAGEERAFDAVFDMYHQFMSYIAIRLIGSEEDAKDIVSDVFLKLWDRRTGFNSLPAIKSFLYVTTRNKALDVLKLAKRQKANKEQYAHWMKNPQELYALGINAELAIQLESEILNLPERCREIVQLAIYEGLSSEEIAARLNISVQTVWNQKTTAVKKIRAAFLKKNIAPMHIAAYLALLEHLRN